MIWYILLSFLVVILCVAALVVFTPWSVISSFVYKEKVEKLDAMLYWIHPVILRIDYALENENLAIKLFGMRLKVFGADRDNKPESTEENKDKVPELSPGDKYVNQEPSMPEEEKVAHEIPDSSKQNAEESDNDFIDYMRNFPESDRSGPETVKSSKVETETFNKKSDQKKSGKKSADKKRGHKKTKTVKDQATVAKPKKKRFDIRDIKVALKQNPFIYFSINNKIRNKSLRWGLRILKSFFKVVRIDRCSAIISIDTGDPSQNGKIFGYVEAIKHALCIDPRRVQLQYRPLFFQEPLSAHLEIKISSSIFKLVSPGLVAICTFPYWTFFVVWMGYRKFNKEVKAKNGQSA